jgi:hypothetical protein
LVVDEHSFGLPYGEYAYAAIEDAMQQKYDTDLRGALGTLFDCEGMAQSVAGQCVLSQCVGHRAELLGICEQGLDKVVEKIEEEITSYGFEALALAGEAEAIDDDDPEGFANTLLGVWDAQIDVSQGPRPLPAEFVGTLIE